MEEKDRIEYWEPAEPGTEYLTGSVESPDVQKYDGQSSLDDLLGAIDVKYPKTEWSDSDRRDIHMNNLEATAKALVSNLAMKLD